jgi:hypothetical protein
MIVVTGALLIALPVAFNLFFGLLAARFDYPAMLGRPTDEVLARFRDGGSRLLLTWWGFAMTALLFAPVTVLVSAQVTGANVTVVQLATTIGVLAAAVQVLGLVRWPFMVPHLARASEKATPAQAEAIDVVFQSFNRYLGVAVGEHLGYLLTGAWTVLAGVAGLQSHLVPGWMGIAGIATGAVLAACSLEFVGPFEREGWKFAGAVVPFAYIAWSLWLAGLGVFVLING